MEKTQTINLGSVHHVHFIGIGGIGISALARMMLHEGKRVSGSDRSESDITQSLQEAGADVVSGHAAGNIDGDVDLVVYTAAVADDNEELREAKERGVSTLSYAEMLGVISREKYTIAISGTHGKTTTTAMIASVFLAAGLDPTVIVGSLMDTPAAGRTNFIAGASKYLIVEACEYKRSFLHLNPDVLVITNVDEDHLDYYRDLADIQSAFRELAQKVPEDGSIVAPASDANVASVLEHVRAPMIDYTGIADRGFDLAVPGEHNLMNAHAAAVASEICGVDEETVRRTLNAFRGTWRRFEYLGVTDSGADVYDDYAHHPVEIQATLAGFRDRFPEHRRFVIFQPHLYSRTRDLMDEFAGSFSDADEVIIAPIYAARAEETGGISHHTLADEIRSYHDRVSAFDSFDDITSHIQGVVGSEDVVITMGAGDIRRVGEALVSSSDAESGA